MEISKTYNPSQFESKWYSIWLEKKLFKSVPDEREPFTIIIPPPNVTGVLHMGHLLNNTLQDVVIRLARLKGKNACWVPGIDHASIATESKIVAKLREEGLTKNDITREQFLKRAWEWKNKHGGIILEQLKLLGASCDWDRICFTMDKTLSDSVIHVFIDLYNKGLIYRSWRMVNWDPLAKTALSDEEVIYKEVQSHLYYVRYQIEGSKDEYITIATTRPETILADTAVCVHPEDPRYLHLHNKRVIIPLVNRSVPLITDTYVEREFGTGALKVTPAHDVNDYNLGLKYNLEFIDIFTETATLNEKAQLYIGSDRLDARKLIVKELEEKGHLVKVENYTNNIGFSERTNCIIEPRLSLQWYLKMENLVKPAIENVVNGNIKFFPAKFLNTYLHWLENIKDWCISRQLWWGHQIPAYYLPDGQVFVANNIEKALEIAKEKTGNKSLTINDLRQDEDVLDTWFSSWLWPLSVFDGILHPNNEDIKYYYPSDVLITAPDIIFFWVARMIIAGYEFNGEKPFHNVYFNGIVRDKNRKKMSKSLGNSPDPIDLIQKYGADGVRVGMLLSSPAGNDLLFEETLCEQGRNFNNKIWNAFRLVKGWQTDTTIAQPEASAMATAWFSSLLDKNLKTVENLFSKYKISESLKALYKLFWDDFCSLYLEIIKPAPGQPIDKKTYDSTIEYFEEMLILLHPFIPFITEELWHSLKPGKENEFITVTQWPKQSAYIHEQLITEFSFTSDIITAIRDFRKEHDIPNKESLEISFKSSADEGFCIPVVQKMANLSAITQTQNKPENNYSLLIKSVEFFIPISANFDKAKELDSITKELEYYKGFLMMVMNKLNNKNFVNNAPDQVIQLETKKKNDALEKIRILEDKLNSLNN